MGFKYSQQLLLPIDGSREPKRPSRGTKLIQFLRSKGFSLTDLARRWDTHKTFPGKVLIHCSDPLPRSKRRDLVENIGVPECLLPPQPEPRPPKKKQPVFISPFDRA